MKFLKTLVYHQELLEYEEYYLVNSDALVLICTFLRNVLLRCNAQKWVLKHQLTKEAS